MTLVELMVAMTVASLAIGSAMAVGSLIANQFKDTRDLSQVERSARMSLELIADSVRSAGPGVQSGLVGDAVGCSEINAIRVTNSVGSGTTFPSATYGTLRPLAGTDVLEVIHASGGVFTTARADVNPNATSITVSSTAGFARGDLAIVIDLAGSAYLTRIPAGGPIAATSLPIVALNTCGVPAATTFAAGALVVRARASRFFVTQLPGEGFPSLMLDMDADGPLEPEPVEPGIEDLQVAIAIDDNNDDSIDSVSAPQLDEWHGNSSTDTPQPHTAIADDAPVGVLPSWRALRVSLSSRSLDGAGNPTIYNRPVIEDHTAGTADNVRHRVLTTVIELRNLKGSQ